MPGGGDADLSESTVSHVGLLRVVLPRLASLSVQSVLLTEEAATGIGRSSESVSHRT